MVLLTKGSETNACPYFVKMGAQQIARVKEYLGYIRALWDFLSAANSSTETTPTEE